MAEAISTGDGGAAAEGADAGAAAAAAGAEGAAAAPWYADLPDDLKDNATLTRYGNKEDAARALISATGRLGVPADQLLRLPKEGDAKAQDEFWNKVGRPEKADGYGEIKLPEGSPLDQAALSGFLATMHKAGPMTPAMAQAAAGWYDGYAKQQVKEATDQLAAARAANETALKGEWGAAYGQNLAAAAAAAERFGGKEFKAFLDESGMGDDPRMLKAFKAVADTLAEPGGAPHERGRDSGIRTLTPAEAKAERVRLEADPSFRDANHSQHEATVARRLELIRLETPQEKQ